MKIKKKIIKLKEGLKKFLPLIKSLQTLLLLFTGITGYISAKSPILNFTGFLSLVGTLFFTISGSTILNMYFDMDIDMKMTRTAQCKRVLFCKALTRGGFA